MPRRKGRHFTTNHNKLLNVVQANAIQPEERKQGTDVIMPTPQSPQNGASACALSAAALKSDCSTSTENISDYPQNLDLQSEESFPDIVDLAVYEGVLLELLIVKAVSQLSPLSTRLFDKTTANGRGAANKLGVADSHGDVSTLLSVMRTWCDELQRGTSSAWCKNNCVDERSLVEIERAVESLHCEIRRGKTQRHSKVPPLKFHADSEYVTKKVRELLLITCWRNYAIVRGHPSLGYYVPYSRKTVFVDGESIIKLFGRAPERIIFSAKEGDTIYWVDVVASKPEEDAILRRLFESHNLDLSKELEGLPKALTLSSRFGERMKANLRKNWSLILKRIEKRIPSLVGSPLYLDTEDVEDSCRIFAPAFAHDEIEEVVEKFITDIKEITKALKKEIPFPHDESEFRIILEAGGLCGGLLFPGESKVVTVRQTKLNSLQKDDVEKIIKQYSSEGVLFDIQQEATDTTKGCDLDSAPWGTLTFSSVEEASQAVEKVQTDLFTLEPHLKSRSHHNDKIKEIFRVKESVKVTLHWLCPADEVNTLQEMIKRFKSFLDRSLDDIVGKKVVVSIRHPAVLPTYTDGCTLLGAVLTFADLWSANKGTTFFSDDAISLLGLPLIVQDRLDCEKQLRSFSVWCCAPLMELVRNVLHSKLANLRCCKKLEFEYRIIDCEGGNGSTLSVTGSSNSVARDLLEAIRGVLAPTIVKLRSKEQRYLQTLGGSFFLEKISAECRVIVTLYEEVGCLLINGKNSDKVIASTKLQAGLRSESAEKWFAISLKRPEWHAAFSVELFENSNRETVSRLQKKHSVSELQFDFGRKCLLLRAKSRRELNDFVNDLEEFHNTELPLRNEVAEQSEAAKDTDFRCSSCWIGTFSENGKYILEACGHVYCTECITLNLKTAFNETHFPVECTTCSSRLTVGDLLLACRNRRNLVPLEQLLKASLRTFIVNNSTSFHPCPKPDCEGVVRIRESVALCSFCTRRMCFKCFEGYHGTMSCEQAQLMLFTIDKWMSEDSKKRKRCPSCRMGIEKIDGCNQVFCTYCQKSICWVCLAFFPTPNNCYDHLNAVHNGVG